jgi:hypothetical protein
MVLRSRPISAAALYCRRSRADRIYHVLGGPNFALLPLI